MRIYISGPMTGHPNYNHPLFNLTAATVRALGHEALNPAELFAGAQDRAYADYIRGSLEMLLLADAILLLDGWATSRGARIEHECAMALGLKPVRIRKLRDDHFVIDPA